MVLGMNQAFIVDGNVLTNKMSIGANTTQDGRFVPGIDTHGNFEGRVVTLRPIDNNVLIIFVDSQLQVMLA